MRTILASLVILLLFPYKSPAPIYGLFPGLTNLIERADAVVVAEIIEKPKAMGFGMGGIFKIRV